MSRQINLFNPIFLTQKKYFSALTMLQALGLLLVGALLLSAWTGYQARVLRVEAASSAAQLALAQSQLAQVASAAASRKKSVGLDEQVRASEAELKTLQQVFDVLRSGELGNTRGYSEYMAAIARQSLSGVWLTGFSLDGAGREITLQGRALKAELVPAYIGRLGREPVLQGKSFAALEIREPAVQGEEAKAATGVPGWVEFNLRSQAAARDEQQEAGRK